MDAQGAPRARPYVDRAGATFTTVVDEGNLLGRLYGFKAIPNGFLIDEEGVVRYKALGGFDIRRAETASLVRLFAAGQSIVGSTGMAEPSIGEEHARAHAHFLKGLELYRAGTAAEAMAEWRRGLELEPDNYIIRKQVWAVENPNRFYSSDVDYAWQRQQREKGL